MILAVFNPDSDLALASGSSRFVAPKHVCQMTRDLCALPCLWWGEGVLTPWLEEPGVRLPWELVSAVEPWAWTAALKARLQNLGAPEGLLPSDSQLATWRMLSHRQTALRVLQRLVPSEGVKIEGTRLCGGMTMCRTEGEIEALVNGPRTTLLKAPWSGSGKGLRQGRGVYEVPLTGWCRNLLKAQGAVMVEPFYDCLQDFAMEFESDGRGGVCYRGLSLFETAVGGAYQGNLVASEADKTRRMERWVTAEVLTALATHLEAVLAEVVGTGYAGPLGVDMMVCRMEDGGVAVHPCVEVNLRRTMGWVSLALWERFGETGFFQIAYRGSGSEPWPEGELLTPATEATRFAAVFTKR